MFAAVGITALSALYILPSAKAEPISVQWNAEYFNNMTLSGDPVLTREEASIDYDWEQGSPDPVVNSDEFSARWRGIINVSEGIYRFTVRADDGIKVFVDGNQIIDGWQVQLATTYTENITLNSGSHEVIVEYFDRWWVGSVSVVIEEAPRDITINTSEPGLQIVVDGVTQTVPYTLHTSSGEMHSLYVPSPQTTPDGRTVIFSDWSNGGNQEQFITIGSENNYTANFTTINSTMPIFSNGFEEGDTSAYPQPNIDVRQGNTLEVNSNHVRTGNYALEISTGGSEPTAVIDQFFDKRSTIYQKTHISLPEDYNLDPGSVHNAIVYKTDDFRNILWLTIGSDYRLSPVYFSSDGETHFPGPFGPAIPRDGSWHEIQSRVTVDEEHGQIEVWLDGEKIVHFTEINTGLAGRDDIHVMTWGSYFSTPTNNHTMYFDDVTLNDAYIQNASQSFQTEVLATGFNLPTYAAIAPDGKIFVAEKDGTIRVVENGTLLPDPLVVIPNVNTYQDRGLLSIALDPNFAQNGHLYAAYSYDINPTDFEGVKSARVIRLTVEGTTADLNTMEIILGTNNGTVENPSCDNYPDTDCIPSDARTHTIGGMAFMADGSLLVSVGDGAPDTNVNTQALRAQNLDILSGKILRINTDGTGLPNNPFYTGNPNDNRSKVWAYGFRNPFRFSVKPGENTIFAGDVGWGTWEEINVVTPGNNYGWPCFEGNEFVLGYSAYELCQDLEASNTVIPPIHVYPHPPGSSIVGGTFYAGTSYPEQYHNKYYFGDYSQSVIWAMDVDEENKLIEGSVEVFSEQPDGPVQIFSGPNGDIYYVSIYTGQLRRITYGTSSSAPIVNMTATPQSGPVPLFIQFSSEGTYSPSGEMLFYEWDFGDSNTSQSENPNHTYLIGGTYEVSLTVSDLKGNSTTQELTVYPGNTPPEVTINTPIEGYEYIVGETINFTAQAIDTEDGVISEDNISWNLILNHCELISNTCHTHPFLSGTGSSGSFTAPDHGEGTDLELFVTTRDSSGLETTTNRIIGSKKVNLNLQSAPEGATVVLNGITHTTPDTAAITAGGTSSLFVPSPQIINGATYIFDSWSNGGLQNQEISTLTNATISASLITSSPIIHTFTLDPSEINSGDNATISWETSNASEVTITHLGSIEASGTATISPTETTEYTLTASNENDTAAQSITLTVNGNESILTSWNSYDTETSSESATAILFDENESNPVILELYESANDDGVERGELLSAWNDATHPETFNNVSTFWSRDPGDFGEYPYIGKSTTARGSESSEIDTPAPEGVYDLQMSPPESDKLITASFIIPQDGAYSISNLAARRVLSWGNTTTLRVFDTDQNEIATIQATGQDWTIDTTEYELGELSEGDRIYFAVDRDGDFVGDATEVTWTVSLKESHNITPTPSPAPTIIPTGEFIWNSYDIEISSDSAQATLNDSSNTISTTLELYESTDDNGVLLDSLFSQFISGNHPETFNNLSSFWIGNGNYPYIGKSSTPRGSGGEESNTPEPSGVFDLQMHPPANNHLVVSAFITPITGEYSISNLSIRRVLPWGTSATLRVFNNDKEEIASLTTLGLPWTINPEIFNLGTLSAGDKIYIAVDGNEDFVGDATEVIFRITAIQ